MEFSRSKARQLRMSDDLHFPAELHTFSPLQTSTPTRKPVKSVSLNLPIDFSSDSDSSANLTERAIVGVESSIIYEQASSSSDNLSSNQSDEALITALEFVSPQIFTKHKKLEVLTRKELYIAFFGEFSKRLKDRLRVDIVAVSKIATERVLWEAESSWKGKMHIPDKKQFLKKLISSVSDESYLWRGIVHTFENFIEIDKDFDFSKKNVFKAFIRRGIAQSILHRIFEDRVVRKSADNSFTFHEISQLIFAVDGVDDPQSIEYWFRILDIDNEGRIIPEKCEHLYKEVVALLNTSSMKFQNIVEQYSDMLGSKDWTLEVLKKSKFNSRVLAGFTNALKMFQFETDEKANVARADDELFGKTRSMWNRNLDHQYDSFYENSSTSNSSSF